MIAAAIDSDTERVADLGEIAEAAVTGFACGAGAKDGSDVATTAGGRGIDGIDAICSGVGDVAYLSYHGCQIGKDDEPHLSLAEKCTVDND